MSWVAEYLLVPLVRYDFSTFGRSARGLTKVLRNLVQDEINEPKGLKEQLKVVYIYTPTAHVPMQKECIYIFV